MKLLLVQPPAATRFGFTSVMLSEPLGLECIGGAVLSRGYGAELVDLRLDGWEALEKALADEPTALGVTCAFTTDVYVCRQVAAFARQRTPHLPVVVGGHHATLSPGDFLYPGSPVGAVCIGEGEATTVELLEAIDAGAPLRSIPGLMTSSNRGNGFVPRRFTPRLDDLPRPSRRLTERYRHRYHHGLVARSASLETSRGCPFDCSFCSVWVFYGRSARRRSAGSILEELERIDEDHVFITDDLAFLDHAAYRELASGMKDRGICKSFTCETRSDLVVQHPDLFELWRSAGLTSVFLGVEKVDDQGLDSVRKRVRGGAGTNQEAVRILRAVGVRPMTAFIVDPGWTEEDFDRLEEYIDRLALPNSSFTILTPLPGTPLFEERQADLTTRDYRYYDVLHAVLPTRLPPERFYQRFARLWKSAARETRPSWALAGNAVRLALRGDLWCARRVQKAVRQLRTAELYLEPPGSPYGPEPAATSSTSSSPSAATRPTSR